MKRLFTLFAAVCCMAGVARAAFSDGVKIAVQGEEVKAEEQAFFTSSKITSGHMSYDPKYHILYMVDVVIEGSTANGLTIVMPDKADFKVTILLCGSSSSKISTSAALSHGMSIYGNVEVRGFDHKLLCTSNAAGIYLGEGSSLTIPGGVEVEATGSNYGVRGSGADKSTLKIDGGNLLAYSSLANTSSTDYASVSAVNLVMEGSEIKAPDGATYDASKNGSIVKSGDYVTKLNVKINQLNDLLYVFPLHPSSIYEDLSQRMGTYALTKGGAAQPNPAPHMSGDEFAASITAGPEAKQWEATAISFSSSGYMWTGEDVASGTVSVTSSAVSKAHLGGQFFKKVALEKNMYMCNHKGSVNLYESSDLNNDMKGMPDMPSAIDANVTCMAYANNGTDGAGNLYFAKEDGSKVGIYCLDWNNYSSASPVETVKAQSDYYPFADLSYNWADGVLYGIAKKTSDSKWYLMKVDISTSSIVKIGELDATSASNPPIALACDNNGALYCMVYKKNDPLLYKVNPTTGKMTLYSHPGYRYDLVNSILGVTTANMYKFHSMQVDYTTNTLYWWAYTSKQLYIVEEIDLATGHGDVVTIKSEGSDVTNNIGMFQELPKIYTVAAKVKDGSIGTAYVNGKSSVKALDGAEVTLTAKGNDTEGTVFKQWNDGNKENPRTVKVTGEATYEAEFWYGEGIAMYPIWICDKQMHDNRLVFNSTNLSGKITAGEIKYDPKANVLLFDKLTMAVSGSDLGVLIGETSSSTEMTIKVTGSDATISGTGSSARPMKLVNADVKIVGNKSLTLSSNPVGVLMSDGSTLTLEGITATLKGSYAVNAYNDDELVIRGSKVTLDGSSNATNGLGDVKWEYCKTDPSNAYYDTSSKKFTKGEGGAALSDVGFSVDGFTVRCEPTEEGTGTFSIHLTDNTGETFENVGWFKSGAKVTIDAYGAEGHNFGYWTDATDKEYSREFTISADLTKQARFFHEVLSSDTWYGIHNGKVASFKLYEFGKEVINPQECFTVTGVKAGDFVEGEWYYVDGTALKLWPFDGGFDKETKYPKKESEAYVETVTTTGVPTGITDYAYNMMGGEHYGVSGKELYTLTTNSSGNKIMEKVGSLKNKYKEGETEKTKDVTGIGIAYDANSTLYVLGADGALYTMDEIDDEKDEVWLRVVGDEKKGGKINETVSAGQQSLAFDHVTGELFWSDSKYIRLIDMDEMKCHIVADLGFKQGSAGVVKAMHRMDQSVTVKALVADSCAGMGKVAVGDKAAGAESKAYFIAGVPVTVTAYPAEGYKFVKWMTRSGKKDSDMKKNGDKNPLQVSASGVTYVAYFEATGEGLESVQNSEFRIQKVIIGGQIYIIKGDKMYNMTGNRVK